MAPPMRRLAWLDISLWMAPHALTSHHFSEGLVTYITDPPHLDVEMDRCFTGVQSTTRMY
jgi:hypothetical protein